MERSQAYRAHKRTIYGLLWPEAKRCYVGQTVDVERRRKEHQRAWAKPFTMITLGDMTGTRAQGEDHEFAWRYRCAESGWTPIAKTKAGEVFISRPHSAHDPGTHGDRSALQMAIGLSREPGLPALMDPVALLARRRSRGCGAHASLAALMASRKGAISKLG